jgi:hypothetical protein
MVFRFTDQIMLTVKKLKYVIFDIDGMIMIF